MQIIIPVPVVQIHDDGKKKYQSITASIAMLGAVPGGYSLEIEAYGATEAEARGDLAAIVDAIRSSLARVR